MIAKIDKTHQLNLYQVPLKKFMKEDRNLVVLSGKIDNELSNQITLTKDHFNLNTVTGPLLNNWNKKVGGGGFYKQPVTAQIFQHIVISHGFYTVKTG